MHINEYKRMIELTYLVLINNRDEFLKIFKMKNDHQLFCKKLRILKRDI